MHDVCLPNHEGTEICLSDYQGGANDLLVVNIAARDCSVCALAAADEEKFNTALINAGWNPVWVTIMEGTIAGGATGANDAANWKAKYKVQSEVLSDIGNVWRPRMFQDKWPGDMRDGTPLFFYVNPSNMKVWDSMAGWALPSDWTMFVGQMVGLFEYCKQADPSM